jgi:hypothetical protein
LLAVGIIATLMIVGYRAKLPPPDPDWRDHGNQQLPALSRPWIVVGIGSWCAYFLGILAALLGHPHVALVLALASLGGLVSVSVHRLKEANRIRRARNAD